MKMSEEARIQNLCGTELRCSCVKLGNTSSSNVKEMSKPVPIVIPQLHSSMKSIDQTGQSNNILGSSTQDSPFKNLCSSSSDATGSRTTINASEFNRKSTGFPITNDLIAIGCNDISFLHKKPMSCPKVGKESKKKINSFSSKLPLQDTRVSVISSSQLEKWSQSNLKKPPLSNKKCPPQDKDFPELSAVLKGLSKSNFTGQSLGESPENEANENSEYKHSKERESSRKSKQPSRKDPISVKIFDIIKKPSAKNLRRSRIHLRTEEKRRLGGNILDSSNPIRKRGKHREIPAKKKLSKLKCVIYSERKQKRERRELGFEPLNEGSSVVGETPTDVPSVESICAQLLPLKIESNCNTNSQEDALVNPHDRNKVGSFEGGLMSNETKTIPQISEDFDENLEVSNPGPSHASPCVSGLSPSTLHSRKFREYCDNLRCKELDDAVTKLLKEIYRFQDRLHQKDPVLALAKRRFVLGIREVKKYLMLRKLKAIVIAPDLEPVQSPGGLDEVVLQIRDDGKFQQIPVIFAVGRRQLGFALKKKVPISAIGIINPEGAEELYQCMLEKWKTATVQYQKKCNL